MLKHSSACCWGGELFGGPCGEVGHEPINLITQGSGLDVAIRTLLPQWGNVAVGEVHFTACVPGGGRLTPPGGGR